MFGNPKISYVTVITVFTLSFLCSLSIVGYANIFKGDYSGSEVNLKVFFYLYILF